LLRLQLLTWFYALLCALLLVAAMVLVMCHSPWFAVASVTGATLAAWGFVSGHDRFSAMQRAQRQEVEDSGGVGGSHGSQSAGRPTFNERQDS
jgi:hypothetical protein